MAHGDLNGMNFGQFSSDANLFRFDIPNNECAASPDAVGEVGLINVELVPIITVGKTEVIDLLSDPIEEMESFADLGEEKEETFGTQEASSVCTDPNDLSSTSSMGSCSQREDSAEVSDPSSVSTKSVKCRRKRQFVPDELKNDTYREKRRRNNESAKRSRAKKRELQKKSRLESLVKTGSDLHSRWMSLRIEEEKLKCDAILQGIELSKLSQ